MSDETADEPRRFVDDSDIGPRIRSDLRVAAVDPTLAFDAAAGLARLRASIQGGGAGGDASGGDVGGASGGGTAGAGGSPGAITAVHAIGAAGVILVAGAVAWLVGRGAGHEDAPIGAVSSVATAGKPALPTAAPLVTMPAPAMRAPDTSPSAPPADRGDPPSEVAPSGPSADAVATRGAASPRARAASDAPPPPHAQAPTESSVRRAGRETAGAARGRALSDDSARGVEPAAESAEATRPPSPPQPVPASEASVPAAGAGDVRREIAQLAEVRRAFEDGEFAAALTLADAGNRRFSGGLLYEEREAIAVRALAELGRPADARKRGERYLARFPSGPHAARVRKAIGAR